MGWEGSFFCSFFCMLVFFTLLFRIFRIFALIYAGQALSSSDASSVAIDANQSILYR